jgi:hypothetical protein
VDEVFDGAEYSSCSGPVGVVDRVVARVLVLVPALKVEWIVNRVLLGPAADGGVVVALTELVEGWPGAVGSVVYDALNCLTQQNC